MDASELRSATKRWKPVPETTPLPPYVLPLFLSSRVPTNARTVCTTVLSTVGGMVKVHPVLACPVAACTSGRGALEATVPTSTPSTWMLTTTPDCEAHPEHTPSAVQESKLPLTNVGVAVPPPYFLPLVLSSVEATNARTMCTVAVL